LPPAAFTRPATDASLEIRLRIAVATAGSATRIVTCARKC
jgi:hypothetical protein